MLGFLFAEDKEEERGGSGDVKSGATRRVEKRKQLIICLHDQKEVSHGRESENRSDDP
jgi:hypothetical protein